MSDRRTDGLVSADFDGDGRPDLFVWHDQIGQVYLQDTPFHFTPDGPPYAHVYAAGTGDLDADGRIDLVAAGDSIWLLRNTGHRGALFEDRTAAVELPESATAHAPDGTPLNAYAGVAFGDIDHDGLLDLTLGQMACTGGPNVVLRNEGNFHFASVADRLGLELPNMNTFTLLLDEPIAGGPLHVWQFAEGCGAPNTTGVRLYEQGDDLPVLTHTQEGLTTQGNMGSVFIDVNGDGVLDELSTFILANFARIGPDFQEDVARSIGIEALSDGEGHAAAQWSMVLLDADLDGRPDAFVTQGPIQEMEFDRATPHDHLLWRSASGVFRDISDEVGLTNDTHNCAAAQGADLDGDGDTDLLVGCMGSVRVLRNDLPQPGVGRTIVLHGSVSNPDGVNVHLTTATGEHRLVRGGGQPFAGGEVRESIRLDGKPLKVEWPSGIEQVVEGGHEPVLEVREPRVLSLSTRRVTVEEPAPVAIEVRPAEMGAPDAPVSVALSRGAWGMPLARGADGIWRGSVVPPPEPGIVKLTVTIGSQTLRVHPRIFVR